MSEWKNKEGKEFNTKLIEDNYPEKFKLKKCRNEDTGESKWTIKY